MCCAVGSSIIFLLVIAIWAVFLLPDLQIRRHHLAQSRAAHRILGRSRILQRDSLFDSSEDMVAETPAVDSEPLKALPSKVREVEARQPEKSLSKGRRRSERRGRALVLGLASTLLLGVIAVPTTVVLSALHVVTWWSVAVAGGALLLGLIGLRVRAMHRSRAPGDTARTMARLDGGVTEPDAVFQSAPVELGSSELAHTELAPTRQLPMVERKAAFDQDAGMEQGRRFVEEIASAVVEPVHGPTAPPTKPRPVVDDRPSRWTPPTVPRPRYLMKPNSPDGPLVAPNIGLINETAADPFLDLLTGDDDLDLPESRAV